MRIADAWPLFDLRLETERLILRLPLDDELAELCAVARAGIHDPKEMPFAVAWTDAPSPEFERGFVQHHWDARARWSPDAWHLALALFHDGRPIGAQSLLASSFASRRTVRSGSWIGRSWQRQGFGKEARAAILAFAFDHLGAELADTEAFLDNAASAGVSRALGYTENGFGAMAPRGVARVTQRFRMTRGDWCAIERPPLRVEGLERCLDLFGARGTGEG